jgi:hypothetical protein
MKAILLITVTLMLFTFSSNGQDKIVMRSGDTLRVKIVKTTPDLVEFTYPNEDIVNTEYKNSINKIIFASGRVDICSQAKKLAIVKGIEDWEKVEITTNPEDVKGLIKLGEVVGKSQWGGYAAQGLGNKKARKAIKKNAAKLGGSIVLLQEKADSFGVKLIGVAYK